MELRDGGSNPLGGINYIIVICICCRNKDLRWSKKSFPREQTLKKIHQSPLNSLWNFTYPVLVFSDGAAKNLVEEDETPEEDIDDDDDDEDEEEGEDWNQVIVGIKLPHDV